MATESAIADLEEKVDVLRSSDPINLQEIVRTRGEIAGLKEGLFFLKEEINDLKLQ